MQAVSLVSQLYAEITALSRAVSIPASDRVKNRQVDELAEATVRLAGAPAVAMAEMAAKLTVLCSRLREDLHPEIRGELLTYLLAESLRDDCRLLEVMPNGRSER